MSNPLGLLAYQNFLGEFNHYLRNTQKEIVKNWSNPLVYTVNSFFRFSEFTHATFEEFLQNHYHSCNFFTPATQSETRSHKQLQKKPVEYTRIESGRVALVTGGTGGIGTEICKRLYSDGHQVIATCLESEAEKAKTWQVELNTSGYEIDIVECDVTVFDSCKSMSKKILSSYRHVDILVNCAGITRDATLKKMDPCKWHAVLDTNLDSVFNVTRNLVNEMIQRRFGRIINISSVNGQKGQFGQTNYSTAKAGIIGFSKALALELADSGITVNTVCPGYVGTSMVEAIPEDIKNSIVAKIPVGRLARPAEIADAVSYLSSDNAGYITGSEISINGGLYTGIA